MELNWLGQAAFKLKGKSATVVTDPFDPDMLGIRWPKTEADIVTISHSHPDHNFTRGIDAPGYTATGPGEYEIKGVAFSGIPSWHDNKEGAERGKNVIFSINIDDVRVTHLGDLGQDELTDSQLEEIGDVDILLIPVGGIYTIAASAARQIISQIEPKVAIPMHYKIDGLKVDLEPVEHFLKEMGRETAVPVKKYTISKDKLPEEMQVVVVEKS